jgi:hypothetical protein
VPPSRHVAVAVAFACFSAFGCSRGPSVPKKDAVLPLLQKEADTLKTDGEKVDPSLGVQSTWTIEGVEVREQPKNEANPFAGTVRFKILTRTKDFDGSMVNDQVTKQFEFVWSAVLNKWIFQYKPTPRPAGS